MLDINCQSRDFDIRKVEQCGVQCKRLVLLLNYFKKTLDEGFVKVCNK